MITDNEILHYFLNFDTLKIISNNIRRSNLELKHPEYIDYLEHRFDDPDYVNGKVNLCSIVSRIYWHIENRPRCLYCGALLNYSGFKYPYGKWCNSKCQLKDKTFIAYRESIVDKEKRKLHVKETLVKKYGNANYNNSEKAKITKQNFSDTKKKEIHEKRISTCIKKYGVKYPFKTEMAIKKFNSEETKEKRLKSQNESMLKLYGVKYTLESKELKEKSICTMLERYGKDNWCNRQKAVKTLKENTGYENPWQIPEIRKRINYDKVINTKIKNGTINSSAGEEKLYEDLVNIFGKDDVIRQYTDERYVNPITNHKFICDFYIKSLDMFIEYQGSRYHNGHPYDKNSEEDIILFDSLIKESQKIHSKRKCNKCQADNVIDTWTKRDPLKRKVTKENSILLLEVWPNSNICELINKYI